MNGTTFNMTKRTLANYCPYRYAAHCFLNQLAWRLFCINSKLTQLHCLWRDYVRNNAIWMRYRKWFHEGYPLGVRLSRINGDHNEKRTPKTQSKTNSKKLAQTNG